MGIHKNIFAESSLNIKDMCILKMALWLLIIQDPAHSLSIKENLTILPFNSIENALTSFQTLLQNMLQKNEITAASANMVYNEMLRKHHAYFTDLEFEIREIA